MEFMCDKCSHVAKLKCDIRNHQLVHSELRPWKCGFPSWFASFKSNGTLKAHTSTHETNPDVRKPHICKFGNCEYRAANTSTLRNHTLAHHTPERERNFQFSMCSKSFFTNETLQAHIETHVKELSLSCNHCNFSTYNRQSLRLHVKNMHSKKQVTFACPFPDCTFSGNYERSLTSHVRSHDPDPTVRRPFSCSFLNCDYRAISKLDVNKHIRARHNPLRFKDIECTLCSKLFYSECGLKAHLNSHHTNETKFNCDKCSYVTHYSSNLARHMREKHETGPGSAKKFECETCGYRANQRSIIATHERNMHTTERKFKCDKSGCSYETNFSAIMKTHLLLHGDDLESQYPFACAFPGCDFRRRSKAEIMQHKEHHETSKNRLKCKLCPRSYPDSKSLHFHSFKYHDRKVLKCSLCDYAVCSKTNLQRHIQMRHGNSSQLNKPALATIGVSVADQTERVRLEVAQLERTPIIMLQKINVKME